MTDKSRFAIRAGAGLGGLALVTVLVASAAAQQSPVRVVQSSDATLYILQGSSSWTLVPDQISDSDAAALSPTGDIDGTLPPQLTTAPAAAPVPVANPQPMAWYIGVWRGTGAPGTQVMVATLAGTTGVAGSVAYPCGGGEWTLQNATDSVATFAEHIDFGGTCVDHGTVTLKRNADNTIGYQWSGRISAPPATLTNVGPSR